MWIVCCRQDHPDNAHDGDLYDDVITSRGDTPEEVCYYYYGVPRDALVMYVYVVNALCTRQPISEQRSCTMLDDSCLYRT